MPSLDNEGFQYPGVEEVIKKTLKFLRALFI